MSSSKTKFSLQEFLSIPESDDRTELFDGEIIAKVSPTSSHSRAQKRLLILLDDWCEQSCLGEVNPEWILTLKRNSVDWVPVPDLAYISYERVPSDWDGQGSCPAIPELVIEIISPSQSFGETMGKVADYLLAGVDRVWVIEPHVSSITIFCPGTLPKTFWEADTISDELFPELAIALTDIFAPRRLPNAE